MEGRNVKGLAADLGPIEGFQMSEGEDEPMPLWDGSGVEGFRLEQIEQPIGALSRRIHLRLERPSHNGRSRHGIPPANYRLTLEMRFKGRAARKNEGTGGYPCLWIV